MNTEDLLARSIAELQQGRVSLDEFLAQYPEKRAELEPLLRLALNLDALRDNPEALPSIMARARMRTRLMDGMATAAGEPALAQPAHRNGYHRDASILVFPAPARARWFDFGRRAAAIAASLVIFMGMAGAGSVSAARDSLPGDFLYSVKIAAEEAQIAFTFSNDGRANVYMDLAERRLWELSRMTEIGKSEAAPQVAEAYDRYIAGAASLSAGATGEGKASISTLPIEDRMTQQQQVLQELVKRAPEQAQGAVAVALGAANQAVSRMSQTVKAPLATEGQTPAAVGTNPDVAAVVTPMGGPGGSGPSGILSGPTSPTGGFGFPDKTPGTPTPAAQKNPFPIATLPALPVHAGDSLEPVAPVTAGSGSAAATAPSQEPAQAPSGETPAASPSATTEPATSPSPSSTPSGSATATPEKPPILTTPPAATGTGTPDKDGGLTQPTPAPRPYIALPK